MHTFQQQRHPIRQLPPDPPHRKRPQYMPVRHEQHIPPTRRLRLRCPPHPHRAPVEPRPYVRDHPIQPLRHVRRRFTPGAPIAPDIPRLLLLLPLPFLLLPFLLLLLLIFLVLLPLRVDLRARQPFVVAVVPLPYVLRHLHAGYRPHVARGRGRAVPGERVAAAEVEELEGAPGAGAGGDVAIRDRGGQFVHVISGQNWNGSREYVRLGGVHVGELGGDDEPVVAEEGAAGGADPRLAVRGQRELGRAGVAAVEGPFGFAVADYEGSGGRHCGGLVGGWWG